jgi:hypothetical protein
MATNVFRRCPSGRLTSASLYKRTYGGATQDIAGGYWEYVPSGGPATVATVNGVAMGSLQTMNGLAIGSVQNIDGNS